MHQRNKYYHNAPDFIKLAAIYPSLKKYIKFNRHSKQGTIDFKDPRACRELTYAILWCNFQIRLEIPLDTLCPVIPGRLDYLHWIEDLITDANDSNNNTNKNSLSINPNNNNNEKVNIPITGIDIGTGASCIYPLLACKLHPEWKFEALELNERSYEYAKDNVSRNNMKNQIKVRRVKITSPCLISPDYSFCMCNPPFYSSEEEMEESRELKIEAPHSICTGSKNEMLTEGGEVQFVVKIIDDSLILQWYTSLIGKKSSIEPLLAYLKGIKYVKEIKTTNFKQGKTVRWGIAWSFKALKP
ncbi:hypothetical protein PIROE2DRAFT_42391 [Piromyces sp. E2]|nr:hypothetical protein PIROE2DRAFT_42391 [Piromyces sp. E2]|eukprot:OUM64583.1 hypothetical protein PIROE2DRAFT_42391 [Piromyces sp. E2]